MTLFDAFEDEPVEEPVEKPRWQLEREALLRGPVDAQEAAAAAVAEVGENADPTWARLALLAVEAVAAQQEEFTTDDVWTWLEACSVTTHEPRALGAVMKTKRAKEVAATTDRYRPSTRPECHARPVRIWRSKVYATDD